jgi:hypothetical protein
MACRCCAPTAAREAGNRRCDTEKPTSPALGLAPPGGALVADLAAGAGGGARERRDRGRMIVRLDLDQDVDRLIVPVDARWPDRENSVPPGTGDDRGVVPIGRQHAVRGVRVRVADHREQRALALDAVDDEIGVEDLVAAVLGVRLREHHQLDIGGVAPEAPKVSSR